RTSLRRTTGSGAGSAAYRRRSSAAGTPSTGSGGYGCSAGTGVASGAAGTGRRDRTNSAIPTATTAASTATQTPRDVINRRTSGRVSTTGPRGARTRRLPDTGPTGNAGKPAENSLNPGRKSGPHPRRSFTSFAGAPGHQLRGIPELSTNPDVPSRAPVPANGAIPAASAGADARETR